MRFHNPQSTFGFNLLEVLLVLTVIVILMLSGLQIYKNTRENQTISAMLTRFDKIVQAAYTWQQGHNGNFCGSTNNNTAECPNPISGAQLVQTNLLTPADLVNPWAIDGSVLTKYIQIAPAPSNPNQLQITLRNLSLKTCQQFTDKLANKAKITLCTSVGNIGTTLTAIF